MEIEQPLEVTYKSARNVFTASQYLTEIRQYDIFAADFETASRYTPEQRDIMTAELATDIPTRRRTLLEAALAATALSHPYHVTLTHCSIAISDTEAYVFILDSKGITDLVLNFLITTTQTQIWHNASFDFKHIYHHTGKFPRVYEDTQLLAKTILNHVDTYKANTGLKQLAGHKYGTWGISSDNFDLSHMYDEHVHHYAAIDACATYWLWSSIQSHLEGITHDD